MNQATRVDLDAVGRLSPLVTASRARIAEQDGPPLAAAIEHDVTSSDARLSTTMTIGLVEGDVERADRSGRLEESLRALRPAAHAHVEG